MPKTKIIVNCIASRYAGRDERIIEFASAEGGGLISFLPRQDGTLLIDLYQLDPTVFVRTAPPVKNRFPKDKPHAPTPI